MITFNFNLLIRFSKKSINSHIEEHEASELFEQADRPEVLIRSYPQE